MYMLRTSSINLVLKIGLMISSLMFAVLSFSEGTIIIAYYPKFITEIIGETTTLIIGSLIAIIMTLWLLSRKQRFAATATYTVLLGLGMLFNLTSLNFLGITWPLFCMAFALSLRYYPRIRVLSKDIHGRYVMKIIPAATAAILASDRNIDDNRKNIVKPIQPKVSNNDTPDTTSTPSTPAFDEHLANDDVANKTALLQAEDFEISHDVEATMDELQPLYHNADDTDDVTGSEEDIVKSRIYINTSKKRTRKNQSPVMDINPTYDETETPLSANTLEEHPRIAQKRIKAKVAKNHHHRTKKTLSNKSRLSKQAPKQNTISTSSTPTLDDIEDIQ